MKPEDYKHQFSAWAQLTEQRLAELCDAYLPAQSELGQAARYSLLGGGKRVRAVLTLAACALCGARPRPMNRLITTSASTVGAVRRVLQKGMPIPCAPLRA